jgi:hypothetical protein
MKTQVIAAAVAIGAGSVTVAAPANAAPGCLEWGWPLQNTLLASGGVRLTGEQAPTNDDWTLSWTTQPTDKPPLLSVGNATITGFRDKPPLVGFLTGSLQPNGDGTSGIHVTFRTDDLAVDLSMDGGISPEGNVVGSSESGGGKLNWRMAAPFVCTKQGDVAGAAAPKADVGITSDEVLGGIIIHVKNNTPDTTDCHYDSEVIDRDFTLKPNETTDLRLVPAVKLFRTWHVTVTCKNGAKGEADIDF